MLIIGKYALTYAIACWL